MSKAEKRALEAYPVEMQPLVYEDLIEQFGGKTEVDVNTYQRRVFQEGYEQAEKEIFAIVKKYLEKGSRCIEESTESRIYSFWDGFLNCAENILRELEEEK